MKEAHGVGDGTEALDRVLELAAVLQTDTVRSLARNGLTPARAHVLWELQHRGPLPQRALAEALRGSACNVTGLVDALEETGFVTREPHPIDRRTTLASFTEAGARTAVALETRPRRVRRAAVVRGGVRTAGCSAGRPRRTGRRTRTPVW
jgi:DNA-binding MarR family transcriptional regulator